MKKQYWVFLSGFTWLVVGISLLYRGLHFINDSKHEYALLFVAVGLLVGHAKSRFVLSKTVKRIVDRIAVLPEPVPISQVYPLSYCLLIGSMIALGVSLRFLPISILVRGTVDVAIGSALTSGALLFMVRIPALNRN